MLERDSIIEKYLKMALKIAHQHCRSRKLIDDYVGEALLTLVKVANELEPIGDPRNYIYTAIVRALGKLAQRSSLVRVSPEFYKRLKLEGKDIKIHFERDFHTLTLKFQKLVDFPSKLVNDEDELEVKNTVDKIVKNQVERDILNYRLEGRNDVQIGELLNLSKARIGQIRTEIGERYQMLIKD